MLVTGVILDQRVLAARARLKGQRGGPKEAEAARLLAELLAVRDSYRARVRAVFPLDKEEETTLASAIHYTRSFKGARRRALFAAIRRARKVQLELP